jgi:teichuronic acid biosynthesis glycosyltransferase TuaC
MGQLHTISKIESRLETMRVLAVTNMYPTPETPGSGTFVERQIAGLKKIGLEVEVIFVDRLKRGMQAYKGLGCKVNAAVEEIDPEVVHVMYGGVMANLVTSAIKNKPTIVTFHGSDILGENLSGTVRKLIAQYGVWASWNAALHASGIIVVSKHLGERLPRSINPAKVRVIPCGIDLDRFKPLDQRLCQNRLNWDSQHFHVLFPANSGDPVKRPELARSAVQALRRSGIAAELHCLKGIPNREVAIWINASDVLLLTSLHEGSPVVVKEALACNVPVVSVDVGDVGERIQSIGGCYVASANADSLAAKLISVYYGPRRIEGRSRVFDLSIEQTASKIKSFYKEVIDTEHRPISELVAQEERSQVPLRLWQNGFNRSRTL